MKYINISTSYISTIIWVNLFILFISGCAQEGPSHGHDDTLSGTWEYHTTAYDADKKQYIDKLLHVKVSDKGESLLIDHCLHNKHMTFTYDEKENVFTNEKNQSMEIIHNDKISSLDVPDFSYLIKSEKTHDLLNAGSITMQSDNLPEISLTQSVCAQRTEIIDDETIIIQLSIPFDNSYIDMTLEIQDMNESIDNLTTATFYSPSFFRFYNLTTIHALSGQIDFIELSDTHAKFNFDIKLEGQFSNFVIDHFEGTVDVKL